MNQWKQTNKHDNTRGAIDVVFRTVSNYNALATLTLTGKNNKHTRTHTHTSKYTGRSNNKQQAKTSRARSLSRVTLSLTELALKYIHSQFTVIASERAHKTECAAKEKQTYVVLLNIHM